MKAILKNYNTSILLLLGVIIGGSCGVVFGEKTQIVKPIGDLFLNLMFCTIVPLVFFSISSAVAKTNHLARLGKILKVSILVFFLTGLISAIFTYLCILLYNPAAKLNPLAFSEFFDKASSHKALSAGEIIVNLFSVSDFRLLFSLDAILPLILFSLAFGITTASLKQKAKIVADFLVAANEIILKIIDYIMKFAPLGLGCYFAYTVGHLGPQLLSGFLASFVFYNIVTILYFFGFFTLYAYIAAKKQGVKIFWKNAAEPSLSAIATSSSAACIPINIIASKKMGVPADIVDTAIPLGANIHKDGSVILNVLKIAFLFALTGKSLLGFDVFLLILAISLLSALVVSGIPSGGVTGQILMLSVLGMDMELLALIMIISTICDIPATLLNSSGNTISSMLIARFTEGKNWLKIKQK